MESDMLKLNLVRVVGSFALLSSVLDPSQTVVIVLNGMFVSGERTYSAGNIPEIQYTGIVGFEQMGENVAICGPEGTAPFLWVPGGPVRVVRNGDIHDLPASGFVAGLKALRANGFAREAEGSCGKHTAPAAA